MLKTLLIALFVFGNAMPAEAKGEQFCKSFAVSVAAEGFENYLRQFASISEDEIAFFKKLMASCSNKRSYLVDGKPVNFYVFDQRVVNYRPLQMHKIKQTLDMIITHPGMHERLLQRVQDISEDQSKPGHFEQRIEDTLLPLIAGGTVVGAVLGFIYGITTAMDFMPPETGFFLAFPAGAAGGLIAGGAIGAISFMTMHSLERGFYWLGRNFFGMLNKVTSRFERPSQALIAREMEQIAERASEGAEVLIFVDSYEDVQKTLTWIDNHFNPKPVPAKGE